MRFYGKRKTATDDRRYFWMGGDPTSPKATKDKRADEEVEGLKVLVTIAGAIFWKELQH